MLDVIRRAQAHGDSVAVWVEGRTYTYADLVRHSSSIAYALLSSQDGVRIGRSDLHEERIAFMVHPGFDYVACLWGIWQAGGVAVPVCLSHPALAIDHVLKDTECEVVVASPTYKTILEPLCPADIQTFIRREFGPITPSTRRSTWRCVPNS